MVKFGLGERVPWFIGRSPSNPEYHFHTVGGRYIVLCFFGSARLPQSNKVLKDIYKNRAYFDDRNACFFGVSIDQMDEQHLQQVLPGIRYFWDSDRKISALYGAIDEEEGGENFSYSPYSLVIDPMMRALKVINFEDPETHVKQILSLLDDMPKVAPITAANIQAPILVVPRVFPPEFCQQLMELYDQHGGNDSGFMRDKQGKTTRVIDHSHKQRADYLIQDDEVRETSRAFVTSRVVPEIEKAFQFQVTRMERYIVACYDSETGGYFHPHRDNTTKGTAHRRFAMTINLNAEDFEGGDLRFPEYGSQSYRCPTGGAVVFSCSVLHEVIPITKGRRFTYLPFLYDDEGAKIRKANNKFLAEDVGQYHGHTPTKKS